jgi:gliding motility-associated-like protein
MKKLIFLVVLLVYSLLSRSQSISINPLGEEGSQTDISALTRSVLGSECIAIGTITSGGSLEQFGYFENGTSNFPFKRGILLTTGTVSAQGGPNQSLNQSSGIPTGGYLPIIEILDDRLQNTAIGLNSVSTRFDFIPQTTEISFRYIFASESYGDPRNIACTNGGNQLQDGFAIIIKGPAIIPDTYDHDGDPTTPEIEFLHGGKNIALLEDGLTEAGMHSIHNNTSCTNVGNSALYVEIPLGTGAISSNGMTVPLSATSSVLVGEMYSIEIMLTDRGSQTLDSSLFIEASEGLVSPDLEDTYTICKNAQDNTIEPLQTVDTGIYDDRYRFQWFLEGSPLENENGPSISLRSAGSYNVEITGPSGCSKEYPFFVSSSSPPSNVSYKLLGAVFTDQQELQVNVEGFGDYLYQLNASEPQASPLFSGIAPGTYQLTVSDRLGCGDETIEVTILDYPKFFTPNSDGINDFWNINFSDIGRLGRVSIFNRYGALIATTDSGQNGWDGTFQGRPMPSSDYWFLLEFEDGSVFKSHFTLKR